MKIQASLQHTIDHNVAVVANTTCQRLEDVITKQREALNGIKADLQVLQAELDGCANHITLTTNIPRQHHHEHFQT